MNFLKVSCILFVFPIFFNSKIKLENPSFEGEPQDATVPTGWMPCEDGTTPDILPGFWGVYTEASDGDTFMGLISREDGTKESVGQRLTDPLEKGECYSMSLDLAHSKTYSGYNTPLKLKVWAATTRCGKSQLIYETDFIEHIDWKTYAFSFIPNHKSHYIIFEAYYHANKTTKGNILLDNCSPIEKCKRV